MSSELHLHPDRLRSHAAVAAALSEELRALLRGDPDVPPSGAAAAEHELLRFGVQTCVRELAELSAGLAAVATVAEFVDFEAARDLARAQEPW